MTVQPQSVIKPGVMPITSRILQRQCACGSHAAGGECEACKKKREATVQRAAINLSPVNGVPPIVHEVLRSPGQPLDRTTRSFMEPRFGHDFSGVRVHTDSQAAESARAVNALAYTVGGDVVFGAGQYAPHSNSGQRLLAHELTHIIQQRAITPQLATKSLQIGAPHDAAEHEAENMAQLVMTNQPPQTVTPAPTSTLQRTLRVDTPAAPAPVPMDSPYIIFQDAIAKLSGRIVIYVGDDLVMDRVNFGPPPRAIESFIRRAMDSKRLYRLRVGATDLGGRPVRGAAWELQGSDVVITLNRAHSGEFTWTVDELLARQLTAAVTTTEPEEIPSVSRNVSTMEEMLSIRSVDDMLTARLPYGSTDATKPEEIKALQRKTLYEVQEYLKQGKQFRHWTPNQMTRAVISAFKADGVTLLQIIHGVETNSPYPIMQRREGNREFVTYEDPNAALVASSGVTARRTTFVPGADATAGAAPQPLTGTASQCTDAQNRAEANSCCTTPMIAEIKGHLETARAYTQRAVDRLEVGAGVECYLKRHFGSEGTEAHRREIAARLRVVASELYLSRHTWKCRPKGSGFLGCEKRDRGTVGGITAASDVNILLCVNPQSAYTDWSSILHETVHRTGVFGEETYKGESSYPGKNALHNADSYARLVEEVGAPGWSQCSK